MRDVSQLMLLNPNDVVGVIDRMRLITKETFDRFVTILTHWYKHESIVEDNIPNIFPIFQMKDPVIDELADVFIESIGWREWGESRMTTMTHNFERNPEDASKIRDMFINNYMNFERDMVRDIEAALSSMNLVYRWDSTEYGGNEEFILGGVILEVW